LRTNVKFPLFLSGRFPKIFESNSYFPSVELRERQGKRETES
jgi:hypothetical protein